MPALTTADHIGLGILARAVRQEKEIKEIQSIEKEIKSSLFADEILLCVREPRVY